MHLQHDMVVCHETYAKQVLGIRPTDRVFSAAKLFFAYGLGNAVLLPHRRGRTERAVPAPAHAGGRLRPDRAPSSHHLLRRPDPLRRHAGREGGRERFDLSSLRLCVSAGEALPRSIYRRWQRALRRGDRRRHRHDGDLHIFLSNRPGAVRPGRRDCPSPATRRDRRRRGPPVPPRRDRQPPRPGRLHDGLLLEQARQDQGHPLRRVDPHRRQVPPGRGRLLLVRRPRRRHAQGRRHLGLADRGRGDADAARAVLEAAVVGQEDDDRLVKPRAFVVLKDPAPSRPRRWPTSSRPS